MVIGGYSNISLLLAVLVIHGTSLVQSDTQPNLHHHLNKGKIIAQSTTTEPPLDFHSGHGPGIPSDSDSGSPGQTSSEKAKIHDLQTLMRLANEEHTNQLKHSSSSKEDELIVIPSSTLAQIDQLASIIKSFSQIIQKSISEVRGSKKVHFVHLNAAYKGFGEKALEHADALTVVGVIAKNGETNPGFDVLLGSLLSNNSNVKYPLKYNFNLQYFLPENTKSFFKYAGSLTTPNCQEVVNWIVMKDFITVSNEQIDRLRFLVDGHGDEMKTVVREVQPLKGRTILQSDSGSMLGPISLASIIFYLIIHILFIQKCILN